MRRPRRAPPGRAATIALPAKPSRRRRRHRFRRSRRRGFRRNRRPARDRAPRTPPATRSLARRARVNAASDNSNVSEISARLRCRQTGSAGSGYSSANPRARSRCRNAAAPSPSRRCPAARCSANGRKPSAATRSGQSSAPARRRRVRPRVAATRSPRRTVQFDLSPSGANAQPTERALIASAHPGGWPPVRRQYARLPAYPHSRYGRGRRGHSRVRSTSASPTGEFSRRLVARSARKPEPAFGIERQPQVPAREFVLVVPIEPIDKVGFPDPAMPETTTGRRVPALGNSIVASRSSSPFARRTDRRRADAGPRRAAPRRAAAARG